MSVWICCVFRLSHSLSRNKRVVCIQHTSLIVKQKLEELQAGDDAASAHWCVPVLRARFALSALVRYGADRTQGGRHQPHEGHDGI